MKILAFIALSFLTSTLFAQTEVRLAMQKMSQALVETQKSDGRFEGAFEADPGFELLSLVLLKKYGHSDKKIEDLFIQKALKWRTSEGFGHYPKGPYAHDVTGLVLVSLKALGHSPAKLGLSHVEQIFERKGGVSALNLGSKILLAPLKLISSKVLNTLITPTLVGLPSIFPLSQRNLGIFRSLIVPLSAWNFYSQKNAQSREFRLMTPGDETRAEEAIEWIRHHQMPNGTWYTLFHALVNIAALDEAEKAGLGQYKKEINRGLMAIKKWRTLNSHGEITQQLTLTTGWDTPQSLMAFSEIPKEMRSRYSSEVEKAISFLDANQIKEPGDWVVNSPRLLPGGWSFIVENRDYPDTDVVAAVLEAKLSFPEKSSKETFRRGLIWLKGLQNNDGGFPAWERGVSRSTDKIIKVIFPSLPDYSDLSQADVTARITRLMHRLDEREVVERGCSYIKKSQEKGKPFWRGRWLVAYLYGTAEAVDTLLSVNCSSLKDMSPSVAWLVGNQNKDGGFGEAHESFVEDQFVRMNSTVMQTSYVVHGLMAYEERYLKEHGKYSKYKSNLDRAMKYLLKKAKADQWMMKERSFTGVIGAKLWYADYSLSPQFMTLRALGRYNRL